MNTETKCCPKCVAYDGTESVICADLSCHCHEKKIEDVLERVDAQIGGAARALGGEFEKKEGEKSWHDPLIEECIRIRGEKAYNGSYAAPREAFSKVLKHARSHTLQEVREIVEGMINAPFSRMGYTGESAVRNTALDSLLEKLPKE